MDNPFRTQPTYQYGKTELRLPATHVEMQLRRAGRFSVSNRNLTETQCGIVGTTIFDYEVVMTCTRDSFDQKGFLIDQLWIADAVERHFEQDRQFYSCEVTANVFLEKILKRLHDLKTNCKSLKVMISPMEQASMTATWDAPEPIVVPEWAHINAPSEEQDKANNRAFDEFRTVVVDIESAYDSEFGSSSKSDDFWNATREYGTGLTDRLLEMGDFVGAPFTSIHPHGIVGALQGSTEYKQEVAKSIIKAHAKMLSVINV